MSHGLALSADDPPARAARVASMFEFWPDWAIYAPVAIQWAWLGLRYLDPCLPTAANPRIATGGLCGESKLSILDQIEGEARTLVPPYTHFDAAGDPARDAAAARRAIASAGLGFPLVLKPDIGCNGAGVRLLPDDAALEPRLRGYPAGARLLLQALSPWEGEAGVFYIRHPHEARGRITSITLKSAPYVLGDGRSTLRELVLADPRAGRAPGLYLPRLARRLHQVPRRGERVRLVFSGNHCKGALFADGRAHATEALRDAVERFARGLPEFHFGRIDLRYESLAALRAGKNFRVIEVNGVGSEATHIWDPDTPLREAYLSQFRHYAEAFRIGRAMKRAGARPCGLRAAWRHWRAQRRLLAAYPLND